MSRAIRLLLSISACLLLTNCQLISTALRLAPLLMLAEKDDAARTMEQRGRDVGGKGLHGAPLGRSLPSSRFADSGKKSGGEGGIRTLGTAFDRTTL